MASTPSPDLVSRWVGLAILLALGGCVAEAHGPSPTDPNALRMTTTTMPISTSTVGPGGGVSAFEECIGAEGVDIGEIPMDGRGRPRMAVALAGIDLTDEEVLSALETCGHWLSGGALDLTNDPELAAVMHESLVRLASCLRDRGVDRFPDPVPGFDGIGSPFPMERVPWTDPDLADAVRGCALSLPS